MSAWKPILAAIGLTLSLVIALCIWSALKVAARADREADEYLEKLTKQGKTGDD
ncbi:MAG: hypothetical protein ACUVRC_09100 [Desulfotomaculales bacterium]